MTTALEAIAKLMTKEQWEQLPEQVRNPFRGRGEREDDRKRLREDGSRGSGLETAAQKVPPPHYW